MIESISLKNWKTHADSSFEFGKGTNVLVGQMGSGKSSVTDAICFALFGTFPSLKSKRLALEEVIMSKPQRAEDASVELAFSYGGKKYRVERAIKRRGSTEAKLYCDGRILAGPKPKDVNAAVERAIEINYNLFSRAVYSEQNEIDSFLRLGPSDRKEKFDELLDLQRYEKVRGNAVTALNRLKGIAKDKAGLIKEQKQMLDMEEEKSLLKRVGEKEGENKRLEANAKEKRALAEKLEKEVKQLEGQEKDFRELKEALGEKKAVLAELEKSLEEIRKEACGKSLTEIGEREEAIFKDIKEMEKGALEKERLLREERKRKEGFSNQAALNERIVQEKGKHLKELKEIGAECPTCRQKLEAKTREQLVGETEKEARKAAEEMEKALKEEAVASAKIRQLEQAIEKGLKEKEVLRETGIKIRHLKESLEKLAGKEEKVKELSKEIRRLEERMGKSKFDEKELAAKRKKAFEEKAAADSAKKAIESNLQLVKELKLGLERIEKTKRQIKELEEKVLAIEKNCEKMNYFINSLLAAQKELRERLATTINEAMHDIWQRIYPYRDYVSAKMDVGEKSYELMVKERSGNWVRVEGILSGGERSAAAICIRIAFSLVLARNLSWLILDEPTHNLDRNAVQTLGKMMQQHLPNLVEQVFVITHDNEMRKAASASLYALERNKDEEGITSPVSLPLEN